VRVTGSGYRGQDRRAGRAVETSFGRAWLVAGITLAAVQVVAIVAVARPTATLRFTESLASLRMASLVLAVTLAVVSYCHWRAVGQAASLHVATAGAALVAVMAIGVAHPEGAVTGRAEIARFALLVAAGIWVTRAVLGPEVKSRLRPAHELLGLGVAGLVAVGAALALGSGGLWSARATTIAVGAMWVSLGVMGLLRAVRRSQVLMGWVAWAVIAIGLSELVRSQAAGEPHLALLGANAIRASALLVAVIGVSLTLSRFAIARRGDVHGLRLVGRRREADRRTAERVRAHEVRNALLAIEGATFALEQYGDRLGDQQRADLRRARHTGLANLRDLLDGERVADEVLEDVPVGHVVTERALLAQSRGLPVRVTGDAGVEARGQASLLAQVVDNLIVNAERHGGAGPQRPVEVVVERQRDRVVALVMDRGPGVPVGHREAIFDAGHRVAEDRQGDGLGLHIARELMRQQQGHLRYEDRAGGGACFTLSLPAAEDDLASSVHPGTHEVNDGR
jgi:signal transduction histidine kinase